MPVSTYVANAAVSLEAQDALAQTSDDTAIVKPQVVQPTVGSREVTTYVVKSGDTVQSIAASYSLKPDTIRWANKLTSDAVKPGETLTILPVDGVIYTTKGGDTLAGIASTYSASQSRIVSYNSLEISGVEPGMQLIIPDGSLPAEQRPGYVAPRSGVSGIISGGYYQAGNGYAFGNCTWYVYNRRVQLGLPVGSNWGNASTWALYARATGLRVDHTPTVGAIVQWNAYASAWIGYAGHVGVVEAVNSDGTIVISEMNNYAYGGFDVVDRRTLSTSDVAQVSNFIH